MPFPTLDPGISLGTGVTLSNGNLTATCGATTARGASAIAPKLTGKWYFEVTTTSVGVGDAIGVRLVNSNYANIQSPSVLPGGAAASNGQGGNVFVGSNLSGTGAAFSNGNTLCVAVNADTHEIWFRQGNGFWNNAAPNDPGSDVGGISMAGAGAPGEGVYPFCVLNAASRNVTFNFGATPFAQAVPSGFSGWDLTGTTTTPHIDLDGVGSASAVNTTTVAANVSTNGNRRKILAFVMWEKASLPSITSVTGSGLTFTQHGSTLQFSSTGAVAVYEANAASALSAVSVTAHFNAAFDAAAILVVPVYGYGLYDANSDWTNTGTGTGTASTSVTTVGTHGLLISALMAFIPSNSGVPSNVNSLSPLQNIFNNTAPVNDIFTVASALAFTSQLSSYSYAGSQGGNVYPWGQLVVGLDVGRGTQHSWAGIMG